MDKIVFTGKSKNNTDYIIRYATEHDVLEMHRYINELSKEQTFISFQGEEITLDEEEKYLEDELKHIRDHKAVLLLVIAQNKIVGASGIKLMGRIEKHIGIFGISLAKDFRNQGIGKQFMKSVLEEAEKNIPELRIVVLSVFANNPIARSLYESLGFIEYGSLPKGVLHKGEYITHNFMYKEIKS